MSHEARYNATGKFTAFSEGNTGLDNPNYVYEWIVKDDGSTWTVEDVGQVKVGISPVIYFKSAVGLLAMYDTSFTESMASYIESRLPSPSNGYSDGIDENGRVDTSDIDKTNGMIIGAALYAINNLPSPTSTPTPTPGLPSPTQTPIATSTASPTPIPTPTPLLITVYATRDNGTTVELVIRGNVASSQISNATIRSNQLTATTNVSFTLTGPSGTTGFFNTTIPKTAILYGTTPLVYIDNLQSLNQGYSQDTNNFYVWYTTQFSTHQITIQFKVPTTSTSETSLGIVALIIINVVVIVLIFAAVVIRRKTKI